MHSSGAASGAVLHLTSLLVQVTPRGRTALLEHSALEGVRFHTTAAASKLIVLLEAAEERTTARVAEQLLAVEGVLTVAVITHLTESKTALDQEIGA